MTDKNIQTHLYCVLMYNSAVTKLIDTGFQPRSQGLSSQRQRRHRREALGTRLTGFNFYSTCKLSIVRQSNQMNSPIIDFPKHINIYRKRCIGF